jgi:MoxR-like ATPase
MSEDQNKPLYTSLAGAVKLIANVPNVRYLLRGEPGVGKSAIRKALKRLLGYPEGS